VPQRDGQVELVALVVHPVDGPVHPDAVAREVVEPVAEITE
jgi:hypothetical protein